MVDIDIPEGATGVVIFAHGSGSSRLSPRNRAVAQALNRAGLATVLFDLLTPEEAADRAKVSRAQWFKWEVHGVIPHPRNARHAAQVMGGVVTDFWDLGGES